MSNYLRELGVPLDKFGWASVQLDGGIEKVTEKVIQYFTDKLGDLNEARVSSEGLGKLKLALLTPPNAAVSIPLATVFGLLVAAIVKAGGLVVVPQNSGFLKNVVFLQTIDAGSAVTLPVVPTLAYGQLPKSPAEGFHVMQTLTDHWIESLTGLGATGVELMLNVVDQSGFTAPQKPLQTHPMLALLQITTRYPGNPHSDSLEDYDLVLSEESEKWETDILEKLVKLASRQYSPKDWENSDFQIARDLLSVSM